MVYYFIDKCGLEELTSISEFVKISGIKRFGESEINKGFIEWRGNLSKSFMNDGWMDFHMIYNPHNRFPLVVQACPKLAQPTPEVKDIVLKIIEICKSKVYDSEGKPYEPIKLESLSR